MSEIKSESVSVLQVAHLLGGQTLIGSVERTISNGRIHPSLTMRRPYELMVIPPESSQETTITLVKFGSILGLMPQLSVDNIDLYGKVLSFAGPDQKLVDAYHEALKRERNPPTKEELASLLHPGQLCATQPPTEGCS
jgi:hypothetical protein